MRVIRILPGNLIIAKFMIAILKRCLFRFEDVYPSDKRSRAVLEAYEEYITKENLNKISSTADAAYAAAHAAADAAATTVDAAYAAATAAEVNWQEQKMEKIIRETI